MLIDVSDVSTIPAEIKQKIRDRFMSLHPNAVAKIKTCKIPYDRDVTCAIAIILQKYSTKASYFLKDLKQTSGIYTEKI